MSKPKKKTRKSVICELRILGNGRNKELFGHISVEGRGYRWFTTTYDLMDQLIKAKKRGREHPVPVGRPARNRFM